MITAEQTLVGKLNLDVEYVYPDLQEKSVEPKTEAQTITPDEDYYGLSSVTVEAVTSDIDSNIKPENIVEGVDILGVEGNVTIPSGEIAITENGTYDVTKYEVANVSVSGGGGGDSKNAYAVATVADMEAITDAEKNDKCLVLESSIAKMTQDTVTQYITFPETVTLDEAVASSYWGSLRNDDYSAMADCSLDANQFRFMMWSESGGVRVYYASEDGIKYTMTTAPETNPVDLGAEMHAEEWNDLFGNFMLAGSVNFGGIYNYTNSIWYTQGLGLNISPSSVVIGTKYYNNGFLEGTLGDTSTKENILSLNTFMTDYATNITWPTDMGGCFANSKDERILLIELNPDLSNVTNLTTTFAFCKSLKSIPSINTSNATNMMGLFWGCVALQSILLLNTGKVTVMDSMFQDCSSLNEVSLLDMSNVTMTRYMFQNCSALTRVPAFKTNKIQWSAHMFEGCTSLVTVPILDMSSNTWISGMFYNCTALTNLGGLANYGAALSTEAYANTPDYILDLSASVNLTTDSLMNVINNLYDIKTKGVKAQQLILGSTNLAKLTSDEIAIATNKGWTVS